MFTKARTKLTLYYLVIIMTISLFFSFIIYQGATIELTRIENMQRIRRPNSAFLIDPDLITETKSRIFLSLLTLNAFILCVSGVSGYFLSGKTLKPISEMMEEQKEFISNASHELRTPLASLKTEIEVGLRDKELKLKTAKDLIRSNLEEVNKMTQLSNYLLELNKFQNRSGNLKFSKVNLADIVKETAGKNKVKFNLEKVIINGDKDSLTELSRILIDNAIKYSDGKDVEIVTRKPGILEVKDKGIGISEKDLPHIFDRFYRGDKAMGKDGYGLGLSIAKQIVDQHSAKIKVESKLSKGSTFKVIFS